MNSILGALIISQYDRRKLLITFLVVMSIVIIDISISSIADIVSKQAVTFLGNNTLYCYISCIHSRTISYPGNDQGKKQGE